MKKFLVALVIISTSLVLPAQQVERGDMFISSGVGSSSTYTVRRQGSHTRDVSFFALHIPAYAEYVIGESIGVGAHFNYSRLFNGAMFPGKAFIMDIGGTLTMHGTLGNRIDMAAYVGAGYTRFHDEQHSDFNHMRTTASGMSVLFGVYPRFYLSSKQRFGIGLHIDGRVLRTKNGTYADDYTPEYDLEFRLLSLSANAGVFYRF
jgi:hypothetical protein